MRYHIQNYDDKGCPSGPPKSVSDRAADVPTCVRKALALPGVIEVELHFEKGVSRAFQIEEEIEDD